MSPKKEALSDPLKESLCELFDLFALVAPFREGSPELTRLNALKEKLHILMEPN